MQLEIVARHPVAVAPPIQARGLRLALLQVVKVVIAVTHLQRKAFASLAGKRDELTCFQIDKFSFFVGTGNLHRCREPVVSGV